MIIVAVAKVPWENITSVSLRRNPWNKVLWKPFRITETSNSSRRGRWCRFHKNLSIVLLARWYSEPWNTKNTLTESVRGFIFTRSYRKPMIISPVCLMVCKAKIFVSRTLSTRHSYCLRFSLYCFCLNSSMRNKTGTPRFLGKWSRLSQSLSGRSPANQEARALWVRDWLRLALKRRHSWTQKWPIGVFENCSARWFLEVYPSL